MIFKNPLPIVDIFEDIVNEMNVDLLAAFQAIDPKIEAIRYQHGHLLEIIETLVQYDKSPELRYEKYPLVILLEDIKEYNGDYYPELDLNVLLVHSTDKNYKSEQRYDNVFKPFLLPMYASLINNINNSKYLLEPDVTTIDHTKTNRLYWGREALAGGTAVKLGDAVDAIEINFRRLKQGLFFCENPISPTT